MIHPSEWTRVASQIASRRGITAVVGESDTGKSSFSTLLANLAAKSGMKVGVLDLDPGQSLIGPPTSIGLALVKRPGDRALSLERIAGWFVGDDSPASSKHEMYTGARMLVKRSEESGIDFLVVNTSGFVKGIKAEKFKVGILKLVKPDCVVVLERHHELSRLAQELRGLATIRRLKVPDEIGSKSRSARRRYREGLWIRHLEGARTVEVTRRKFANMPQFTSRSLKGTVVGLYSSTGDLLEVGVVTRVHPDRVAVLTKADANEVSSLEFGRVKAAKRLLS